MTIEQGQQGGQAPSQGQAPSGQSALTAGAGGEQEWTLPEKFTVKTEAGEIDHVASNKLLGKSYSELEKRLGGGDAPPKSDDEYKVEGIDGFNFDEFKAIEENKAFLKSAHAKGLTNAQLGFVLGEYNRIIPELLNGNAKLNAEDCAATLKQEWGDKAAANFSAALRAGRAAGLTDEQLNSAELGSNPTVIKLLAHFGAQLDEDTPPNWSGAGGGEDIQSLMSSDAYRDPKHPDHARTYAKVEKYYQKLN